MQLHLLAVHDFLRIDHVLNQLTVRSSGWVNTDHALRLFLTLFVGGLLLHVSLIAVQRSLTSLIGLLYGRYEHIADVASHRLVRGWITYDK